jgi:hypothetical protein
LNFPPLLQIGISIALCEALLLPNDVSFRIIEGQATHREVQVPRLQDSQLYCVSCLSSDSTSSIPALLTFIKTSEPWQPVDFSSGCLATTSHSPTDSADGATTPSGSLPITFGSLASHLCQASDIKGRTHSVYMGLEAPSLSHL